LRPPGYRVPSESGNSAVARKSTGNKSEYLLCVLTFPIKDSKLLLDPNVWLVDTVVSVHMTTHQQGLLDMCTAANDAMITMGNGSSESAPVVIGTLPGTVCAQYGNELNKVAIENVSYLLNGTFNLFSLTQMILKGWVMGNNTTSIWIEKGRNKVTFNLVIPTPKGIMFAMYFAKIAGATIDKAPTKVPTMMIDQAHVRLGHMSEDATRKTVKALNLILTKGTLKACDACAACAATKAKQKNVPKTSSMTPSNMKKDESQIYLDIATINRPHKKQVYKKNWRIMLDERTGTKFTDFYETEAGMIEPTCAQLHCWKLTGHGVKYIRMDNAVENITLHDCSDSSNRELGIKFEYTA
jgi:hypothetical protein